MRINNNHKNIMNSKFLYKIRSTYIQNNEFQNIINEYEIKVDFLIF